MMGRLMGRRRGSGAVAQYFTDWANANVLFDGSSIVAGEGALYNESKMPAQLSVKAPLSSVYTRVVNLGVNGQTFAQMRGRVATEINTRFIAGKRNILGVWGGGTNAICNVGGTAASAIADLTGYIADVRAAHPEWYIIVLTELPRGNIPFSGYTVAQANAQLDAFNATLKANFLSIGANAVVDVRVPGSPFALTSYTTADFNSNPFSQYMGADKVHPQDAGYALVADQVIAQSFYSIPA